MPADLSYPIILKLAGEDASLGITTENVVYDDGACRARLQALFAEHHAPVLAEQFIEGREFTVAVLDREPIVLEEIVFTVEPKILCYRAKWASGSLEDLGTRAVFEPEVSAAQRADMFDLAIRACDVIGTRDYSRVDFRMNERGEIYVLEVNPNPDITPNSGYRGSLQAAGIAFPDFVSRIVSFCTQGFSRLRSQATASSTVGRSTKTRSRRRDFVVSWFRGAGNGGNTDICIHRNGVIIGSVTGSNWRTVVLVAIAFILGTIAAGSGSLRAAWTPMARLIGLQDPPVPASANVLSEHEIEGLDTMPPQSQAELLLERSINHYRGANEQIARGSIAGAAN